MLDRSTVVAVLAIAPIPPEKSTVVFRLVSFFPFMLTSPVLGRLVAISFKGLGS
jgi:hypothetical protein